MGIKSDFEHLSKSAAAL